MLLARPLGGAESICGEMIRNVNLQDASLRLKGGRSARSVPFPRLVLDVYICRQPHFTVYYGNLPPTPPPRLSSLHPSPFFSSTSPPPHPTLRTVLLSRRCSQFNSAAARGRRGGKGEGLVGGGYVGIRDELKSRGREERREGGEE